MPSFKQNISGNFSNSSSIRGCFDIKCLFTDSELWAIVASLSVTFVASLIGNVFVCILILKNRHLRNSTNYSIMNLSIADLLVTVFCMPVVTVDLYVAEEWIFGRITCKLVSFIQNIALDASILSLMIISMEKFLMVWFPFFLRDKAKHIKWFLLATWIFGILQSSVLINYREVREFDGKSFCMENWPDWEVRRKYMIARSIVLFFVPLFSMFILHTLTITRIHSIRTPMHSKEAHSNGIKKGFIKSLKSDTKMARKKKAMNTLVLIFVSFALCSSPVHVYQLWTLFSDGRKLDMRTLNITFIVVVWLMFFNCACHPVIYGLAGNKYRKAIRNSFSRHRTPNSSFRSSFKRRSSSIRRKQSADNEMTLV